jgi:hypothetical protein
VSRNPLITTYLKMRHALQIPAIFCKAPLLIFVWAFTMLAHKLEKSGTGRPVLSQLAQAQDPISDLRAAAMKMEFAFAICAALLMGAGQISKHAQGEASTPAREAHVSPKKTNLSATAGLAKQDPSTRLRILKSYGNLPLTFEENRGQIDPQVKFLSRSDGYTLFLTADEAVLSVSENKPNDKRPRTNRGNDVQRVSTIRQSKVPAQTFNFSSTATPRLHSARLWLHLVHRALIETRR